MTSRLHQLSNIDEIINKDEKILHQLFDRTVTGVGENLVVKSGKLRSHEAQTLRFIAENTTIPVPNVYDVRWEDGQVVAITMDYMSGKRLDEAWETLDPDQKLSIAKELHSYINQLRDLKGDYIGAVNPGKTVTGRAVAVEGGPFDTEQQFNESLLGRIIRQAPDLLRHYARHALSENHEIVFTHSDIAPEKFLVEGGRIAAILDWEDAGWYPEYWEYTRAFRYFRPMPDWPEYLTHILPPKFEREYIGMAFLNRISY
ncbi:Aminoglycoside phosphotransferase [Penicillium malachiteum]|uniref:Aminoglycoside phosphotransferase n=1 Tax=Penicillium malachiteum TaxID=1324776 RepID=UPI0025491306|nr:Aminoglycoside phosphotransferase [Penicillium malachiteum]KAJ5713444.1 Aminoglycoside phosphotransferase [Penicillium malachiteum]